MTDPSFYYAIFKKFQAVAGGNPAPGFGHVNSDNSADLDGGFSLLQTQDHTGSSAISAPHAGDYTIDNNNDQAQPAMMPLNPNSNDPMQNPLFAMLKASLSRAARPARADVFRDGERPGMAGHAAAHYRAAISPCRWIEFNTNAPLLIDAFGTWINNGKIDDAPKNAPLVYATLSGLAQPKPSRAQRNRQLPLLFVASMPGDDGRRHGDHAMPAVPIDHVPANFWDTSQIFLTYNGPGNTQSPRRRSSPARNITWRRSSAMPATGAPAAAFGRARRTSTCWAMRWPSTPSSAPTCRCRRSATSTRQHQSAATSSISWPGSYDVGGLPLRRRRRCSQRLKAAMQAAASRRRSWAGCTIDDWVRDSHPCVKVRIIAGENANNFTPPAPCRSRSSPIPRKDRHIAQHNLAPFDMTRWR